MIILGRLGIHMQAKEQSWTLNPIYKNSEWIKDLNVRPKTKFLEENIGHEFCNTVFGNDFLDKTLKEQATKEKN